MNRSILFAVLSALSLVGLAQSASSLDGTFDKNDLIGFYDTLSKLEAAHKEKSEPTVDEFDLSHVASVVRGIDTEDEIEFVREKLPLIHILTEAIRKYARLSEKTDPWYAACDKKCVSNVVADYLANRPAELTGETHDFSASRCERLTRILLERDHEPLTDKHIHDAIEEYKAYMSGIGDLGGFVRPVTFELYNIERTVDYTNRLSGRLLAAMWPIYHFRTQHDGFANSFKHSVYEMLHANGLGVRNGQLVKVPKVYKEFIP